jgi:hypothetical protein
MCGACEVLKCHQNLNHSLVLNILTMFRRNLIFKLFFKGTVNRSPDNRGSTVYPTRCNCILAFITRTLYVSGFHHAHHPGKPETCTSRALEIKAKIQLYLVGYIYTRWFKYDRDLFVCKHCLISPGHI